MKLNQFLFMVKKFFLDFHKSPLLIAYEKEDEIIIKLLLENKNTDLSSEDQEVQKSIKKKYLK